MEYIYKPKSNLEKFGLKIYNLLVENFSQTFFVGGMVRDLLLHRKVTDIDIATEASPEKTISILQKNQIEFDGSNQKYGIVIAKSNTTQIEIATLRKDIYKDNRYPKVKFIKNPRQDSQRRDFTINSLYLSTKKHKIYDFHNGLADLKNRQIKFIGDPAKKIKQDPLRTIRALRFALMLNFKVEKKSYSAIKKYFYFVNLLTKSRISKEINKLQRKILEKMLRDAISSPKLLDKYFKMN